MDIHRWWLLYNLTVRLICGIHEIWFRVSASADCHGDDEMSLLGSAKETAKKGTNLMLGVIFSAMLKSTTAMASSSVIGLCSVISGCFQQRFCLISSDKCVFSDADFSFQLNPQRGRSSTIYWQESILQIMFTAFFCFPTWSHVLWSCVYNRSLFTTNK